MGSMLDRDDFNSSLFFPRRDATRPPRGAADRFIDVGGHGRLARRRRTQRMSRITRMVRDACIGIRRG